MDKIPLSGQRSVRGAMEWIVTTARTVEEAQNRALALLGVDIEQADLQVIETGARGVFGRTKREARVRARIKPKPVAARSKRGRVPRPAEDVEVDGVGPPSIEEVIIQGVSWTEVTASTVEDATIHLLDHLGADGADADVRVIGRTRGASRVRGRVESQRQPERPQVANKSKKAVSGNTKKASAVLPLTELTLRRGQNRQPFHLSMERVVAETQRLEGLDTWEEHSPEHARVRRRKDYLLGYMRHPADGDATEQAEADRIAVQLEIQNLQALVQHEPAAGEIVNRTVDILRQIADVDGTERDARIASTVAAQTAALVEEPIIDAARRPRILD